MKIFNSRKFLALFTILTVSVNCNTILGVTSASFDGSSKLASGKWMKITVPTDGVYELTADELKSAGFDDITKVKIFGHGGKLLSESLEDDYVDDLKQVPTLVTGNKLCFYGAGPATRTVTLYSTSPFAKYTQNCYSTASYYFITDNPSYYPLAVTQGEKPSAAAEKTSNTSYGIYHHELELCTPSSTGKTFLGEDFDSNGKINFNFTLPNYVSGSLVNFYLSTGIKSTQSTTLSATVNSASVKFMSNSNSISKTISEYVYYNTASSRGTVTPTATSGNKFDVGISYSTTGSVSIAKIDFFTLTYIQNNVLAKDSTQLDMMMTGLTDTDKYTATGVGASAIVWNVTNPESPVQCASEISNGTISFMPNTTSSMQNFVLFDPSKTLKKVTAIQSVSNQNLHGMAVPDMVIVTTPSLKGQAQRIADLHQSSDNMSVAIVEQQQIFNEFSSGAPDAMAIRLFMKMLYLREPKKIKYLLLFGGGSVDNRQIISSKNENLLLAFESTTSNNETRSYTCDNFFGMLADGKGFSLNSSPVSIAVGRIPAKTVMEAEQAVDKLLQYVSDTDFEDDWRNNILVVADRGDSDVHEYQSEGIINLINDECSTAPVFNKVFNAAYPTDSYGYAVEARNKIAGELKRGQLIMTYVGHGAPNVLTKVNNLWRKLDAKNVTYKHLPFVSLASCNIARFDDKSRGIAEDMFFAPNGGMIAGMAASRSVTVSDNNTLNLAMIKALLKVNDDGSQNTIGEAFRRSMAAFGNAANTNKLSFQLFGDPAMKLNYPRNLAKITTVNGTSVASGSATIYPMTKVKIEGSVTTSDGKTDTGFNGTVTITLLDKQRQYKNIGTYTPNRLSNYSRNLLAKADGKVTSGKFKVELTVPANCEAQDEQGAIAVYANRSNSTYCVNGMSENVVIASYNSSSAISDTKAPVIGEMYLNSPSFKNGDAVLSDPNLHVSITDNTGVCAQALAIGNSPELILDGGQTSYSDIKNIIKVSNSGKQATIDFTVPDLTAGKHSLTLYVSDIAGNRTSRSIDFYVDESTSEASLTVASKNVRQSASFELSHGFTAQPETTIFVIDGSGKTVWKTTTSSFPYEWNLIGNSGKRVPAGVYRYYGILSSQNKYASTPMQTLVVLNK